MNIRHNLLFLLTSFFTFGQDSAFFDRSFHHRVEDSQSTNKREYIANDSLIEIKDFNKNGVFRTGKFYGFSDLKNLDEFIWCNSNRQFDKSPNLKIDNRKGIIKTFNKDGKITSEQLFIEDQIKFIQLWNKDQPQLTKGSGTIQHTYNKRNEKMLRQFKDSLEVEAYIVRELKQDTIFYKTDTHAYPKRGMRSFYNDIATNVNYPGLANLLGIDKKITIQFVVDENGNLTEFEALNKKSLSFEKKAIRKLERMPKWIPATLNGKNVKTRFTIPITFRH